ncbi:DivIVA domain-containing protein [Rathayibacter sp. YIM 133350]|uniref:DivIVA domain-containing protein n=1 Tax=Rathayibacter sp. YIM 133350 TaxID=3131992 RepID=UPI00307FB311
MSSPFPLAHRGKPGYNVEQVDAFLLKARAAYDSQPGEGVLSADDIRRTAFSMQKGGYSTQHVDAALERLEDAFATREREHALQALGNEQWYREARATAQVILNRLDRPKGHRFERTSVLTVGYSTADVDRFAAKLTRYFQDGYPLSVDDVRTIVFRPQRGGYREAQVDVVLDSVVDVMLAVR